MSLGHLSTTNRSEKPTRRRLNSWLFISFGLGLSVATSLMSACEAQGKFNKLM
jgi:hypothetical protein